MYQALVGKHKRMSTSTFKIGKFSLKEEIFHKTHMIGLITQKEGIPTLM